MHSWDLLAEGGANVFFTMVDVQFLALRHTQQVSVNQLVSERV